MLMNNWDLVGDDESGNMVFKHIKTQAVINFEMPDEFYPVMTTLTFTDGSSQQFKGHCLIKALKAHEEYEKTVDIQKDIANFYIHRFTIMQSQKPSYMSISSLAIASGYLIKDVVTYLNSILNTVESSEIEEDIVDVLNVLTGYCSPHVKAIEGVGIKTIKLPLE